MDILAPIGRPEPHPEMLPRIAALEQTRIVDRVRLVTICGAGLALRLARLNASAVEFL